MGKSEKNDKKGKNAPAEEPVAEGKLPVGRSGRLEKGAYEKELRRLQTELVRLQEWVRHEGLKVVILFEGRDAAGK
ncbi:MAG: polyphosphate kinase 2, partial [Gemmatimonadetes bacterium]|nr:polyphosphate kinase 2 [Gemmatimonadota bacterium]